MTLAAQLGTLPLLIFHFGRLSLISPLANLMIVPFLPAIMLSGMALSFSGLLWPLLSKIAAWPIRLLLSYVIKTIEYLSSVPGASYEMGNFSWVILVGYYLALMLLVAKCLKTKSLIS